MKAKRVHLLLKKWREISKTAVEKNGKFTVALSGGKSPRGIYRKLSESKNLLPWKHTHIFQVDERFVPRRHPDSNYSLIKKNLLKNTHIPKRNIHPIGIGKSAALSAARYEKDIRKFFNLKGKELPKFDLIMLGIGEDGHTASLFSTKDILNGKDKIAIATNPRNFNHERISLTLSVINNAEKVIFITRIRLKGNRKFPASLVKPKTGLQSFSLVCD